MGNEFYRPRIADKVLSEKLDAMNEDLANIQNSPIRDYKYARFFDEVQYNGKTLSDAERKELVVVIDDTIAQYSEGLPMMYDTLKSTPSLLPGGRRSATLRRTWIQRNCTCPVRKKSLRVR